MATFIELLPDLEKGRFIYRADWKENEKPSSGESVGYDGELYWYTYCVQRDAQRGAYLSGITLDYSISLDDLKRDDWQLDTKIEHRDGERVIRKEG